MIKHYFDKKRLIIILIIVCLVVTFFILKHFITYPLLHVEYNGKVTDVRFDIKGQSRFQINNEARDFQMFYLDCDLKLGDSMVKKLDDKYIYHYREKKLIGIYSVHGGRFR